MRYFIVFLFLISLFGCTKTEIKKVDVSGIKTKVEINRFDQKFYTTKPENLRKLKAEFPYLFPEPNPDSVWINKMTNKDERELFAETQKVYGDLGDINHKLENLFKHIKYYYPNFKEPKVITLLTNVDYNNKVVLADSLLFISLDNFLGKDSKIYVDFPNYIKQNNTKEHLIVAVAEQFVDQIVPPTRDKSFVSRMIQEGKKLALIQSFLSDMKEDEIIGYLSEQMQWAKQNEVEIWKYFVQNLMLYSTDFKLTQRFIDDAPFSKFYLELDQESPGRIGSWFGWKIVKAYLKNNEKTVQELLKTENEIIFNQSKYKPNKK